MSVTDVYAANDVIYKTLENGAADAAWPSLQTPMFGSQEIIDCLNRVQQDFMLQTGMILTRTTITASANVPLYDTPADSIRPRRIAWTDQSDSLTRTLTEADTWELDNGLPTWNQDTGIPLVWYESNLPQQQFGVSPTPINNGTIDFLYQALTATLDGSGILLTVPDDWSPYIVWGTLGELLSSDGQGFDPVRARYCSQRYEEGIELARIVLGGMD